MAYTPDPYNTGSPTSTSSPDPRTGIADAYKKYLGRAANQQELDFHARTSPTNWEDVIKNSSEAQAWSARSQPTSGLNQPSQPQGMSAPSGGFSEQAIRDEWSSTPDHSPANLARIAQKYGLRVEGRYGDVLVLPDGRKIDAIMDAGNANNPGWIDLSVPGGVSRGSTGHDRVGGGSSSSSRTSSTTGVTTGGIDPQINSLRDSLIKQLLERSHQSLNIDAKNDANIRQQADPYAANVERSRRNYIADLAERKGPLANLQGEERLASERAGQATGLFESQLVGRELDARRQEIQAALTQQGQLLTAEQEMSLRKELAQLEDATRRLGIRTQNEQFNKDLGFQIGDRDAYWRYQWAFPPSV